MRKALPLVLGLLFGAFLLIALWPSPRPVRRVVIAGRDIGAGEVLQAEDLRVAEVDPAMAPEDALRDPAEAVGRTLAVPRFAGEPISPRHLGPAVTLDPDERAVGVRVKDPAGVAGLIRPGSRVSLFFAVLDRERGLYAKAALSGLRVVYVPPAFYAQTVEARPMTLRASTADGGLIPPAPAPPPTSRSESAPVVLAASLQPQTIVFRTADGTTEAREVSPAELLVALGAAVERGEGEAWLALEGEQAAPLPPTAGLFLSELLPVTRTLTATISLNGGGP